MKQKCVNLPGITEIRWMHASLLSPGMMYKHLAGIPVAVMAAGTRVSFFGEPTCQAVEEDDNNGTVEKTTFTFCTNDELPSSENVVWAVRQASGQWWLIGCRERPRPVMKVTSTTGTTNGDPAVKTVEISHQARKSLIPVAL